MKKISFLIALFILVSFLDINCLFVNAQFEQESFLSTTIKTEDFDISLHKISTIELDELKNFVGVYKEGKNYNIIINGSGTGLMPPTEDEWQEIAKTGLIAYNINTKNLLTMPSKVDHSKEPCFPPIGNQYTKGSCTCFSVVYYIKTYQEAKEHGWDLSNANWEIFRGPSKEYQDKIFSPDFVYHQINNGIDEGSSVIDAMDLINDIGVCTWKEMPYDTWDYIGWPSESAFREAPLYRSKTGYNWLWLTTDSNLNNLKRLIAGGNLATIMINGDSCWSGLFL